MSTTTNKYGLALYEGTDLFNPLTVNNPNFEIIDSAMESIEQGTIGVATELLSGTVHALTRTNPDTSVFRFTATANWTAGDTFTVDGVQVSALLPNGTTLTDGAYVINATVLCVLVGTLLTVFVPGGDVALAKDSQKLGGELPNYYGKASDVANAISVANAAGTLANDINAKLTDIISATLNPGDTDITLVDTRILASSIIEPYFSVGIGVESEPISYKTMTVNVGSVSFTFDAMDISVEVGIRVI